MAPRRARTLLDGFLFAASILALLAGAAAADTVRIGGTGAASEPFREVGVRFTSETLIAAEIIPGLGSSGGISAVADGVVSLAVSGRPPTASEMARGLTTVLELCTPYVLASSHREPGSFERDAVAGIYAQENPKWPDGTPIKIILRPKAESDNATLAALFPDMERGITAARMRPSVPIAATDQDNADLAEQIPGSLIGATYAQIFAEHRDLRFVAIGGMPPDVEAYETGRYPLGKRLLVIMASQTNRDAERFLEFLRSPAGVRAMRGSGIVACPA